MYSYTWTHQCQPTSKNFDSNPGCSLENLPGAMTSREWWQERVKWTCAVSMPWCVRGKDLTDHHYILYLLVGKVFANGLGDLGSISGHIIPKTLKMVLDTSLLNTQQYKVRIKSKVEESRKRVVPSPTPRCSSYWKGSILVALDYSPQLYLLNLLPNKLFVLKNFLLKCFNLFLFFSCFTSSQRGSTQNRTGQNFYISLIWRSNSFKC